MKNNFICYAIFVAGVALFYGTEAECKTLSKEVPASEVLEYNHF